MQGIEALGEPDWGEKIVGLLSLCRLSYTLEGSSLRRNRQPVSMIRYILRVK